MLIKITVIWTTQKITTSTAFFFGAAVAEHFLRRFFSKLWSLLDQNHDVKFRKANEMTINAQHSKSLLDASSLILGSGQSKHMAALWRTRGL